MRYALFIATLLHAGILAAGFIIAPFLPVPEVDYSPVVPVELLSQAEFADELSVKADRKSEPVEEDEEPEPVRQQEEEATLPDPEPEPVPDPEETQPEPQPAEDEPEQQPEDRPEPEEEPRREEPKQEDDFFSGLDDALVDLENQDEWSSPAEVVDPEGVRNQEGVGLGDRLTASEIDLVRQKMAEECFDQPTGVPNAEKIVVRVRFNLNPDGEIVGDPEVLNARQIALSNNSWWRTTRDRAVQAVVKCQPYDYLPEDRYYIWSEMILNFSPQGVM